MSAAPENTVNRACNAADAKHQYIPYKVKLEGSDNENKDNKDFSLNLTNISMENLIMMMRTEAIRMKDYIEAMPPSQSAQLSPTQVTRLMSEHVALSPAEILQQTEHQLLLAISKQLETIDEFDNHLGSNITSTAVNAMQDLCSVLSKQHSCMRSQQHKLPKPSSTELGKIIIRLEKISAHMYINIPKLKLGTFPTRNGNSLKRFSSISSEASPSKLMLKKTRIDPPPSSRHLQELKSKMAGAVTEGDEDVEIMRGENQIFIEEDTSTVEDNQESPEEVENDALMIDPREVEDETEIQLVHHNKQRKFGTKQCSHKQCRVMVTDGDPHESCTAHSPCMASRTFDPTSCPVCLDMFQKANSGDGTARRIWRARLRNFRTSRYKRELGSKTSSWASPAIAARFMLSRIGAAGATPPPTSPLAPVPPLIRIERQDPQDQEADKEATQQRASTDLTNWKAVMRLIDDFFGRPNSSAIPYIRMVVYKSDIESPFVWEMLMLLLAELEKQISFIEFNGVQQNNSQQTTSSRFNQFQSESYNVQEELHAFQRKLLAVLVNHDIPMSHIESYLSPHLGALNKGIASLAAQEWLSPEQSGMLPTTSNWETQFIEGNVKTQLQSLQLSQQALNSLQQELLLQLQTPSTVAAKRMEGESLRNPTFSNGETSNQKIGSGSTAQYQNSTVVAPAPSTPPPTTRKRTRSGKVSEQQQEQQHISLERVADVSNGTPAKKAKTSSTASDTFAAVSNQVKGPKSKSDAIISNEKPPSIIPAKELCEEDREMMKQQRDLLTQMEMPSTVFRPQSLQTAAVISSAQQPQCASHSRQKKASVSCEEYGSGQKQRGTLPDLQQQPRPGTDAGGVPANGFRQEFMNQNSLQPANTPTTCTALSSSTHANVPPTAVSDSASTGPSAGPSHNRKQLAPKRAMRSTTNKPQDDVTVSVTGDTRASANNSPTVNSSNGNSCCSSIVSGSSIEGGSRRSSLEIEDESDVCEVMDSTRPIMQTTPPLTMRTHVASPHSAATVPNTAASAKANGVTPSMSNGVCSDDRNGVVCAPGKSVARTHQNLAAGDGCGSSSSGSNLSGGGSSNSILRALRIAPSASKRYANKIRGDSNASKEADPHPGEGWFQAPAPALFKMIDNEFVMRFHGNMYKSPEVDLQYFNKKMWFKVNLNCTKTIQLLKYVEFKDNLNSRNEKTKVLRLDVFKRMTQIFTKSFTPTASVSNKNFCSINIEHFPSQIQHLIYKQKAKEACYPLTSSAQALNDKQKFDLERFLERHWIYDLCSSDGETQSFLDYLEQKDPSINSYSALLNPSDELVRLKEEEALSRARLLKMSTILCGQELITDVMSKINAQIDNTYTQQFRINNGNGVDESATASSSSCLGPDTGFGSFNGKGLRSTPVERTLKETLIQLEQFHRGVETQSNSLMAVLMEEAAACKLKWRRLVLNEDDTSHVAERLLRSNAYTTNLFDETVVEEVRKELKLKCKKTMKKKVEEQSAVQTASGSS